MLPFIASHERRDVPGTSYMYSSGDTTFLAGVVDAALRPASGEEYAFKLLVDPLGMTSATFEGDARGIHVGSSYLYARPGDLARFGWFVLNDGCWEGKRILPENWIRDSVVVSPALKTHPLDRDVGDVEGRQFWLNRPVPELGEGAPWPDVPRAPSRREATGASRSPSSLRWTWWWCASPTIASRRSSTSTSGSRWRWPW